MNRQFFAGFVAFVCGISLSAAEPIMSSDLSAVPNDSFGFVHVKIAEVWKSPALKDLRELILKSGDEAIKAFEKRFSPSLMHLETATAFLTRTDGRGEPSIGFILAFNREIDRAGLLQSLSNEMREEKTNGLIVYLDRRLGLGFHFVDKKTLLIATEARVVEAIASGKGENGPLSEAKLAAAKSKSIYAAMHIGSLNERIFQELPPAIRALGETELVTMNLNFNGNPMLQLNLDFPSEQKAKAAEQSIRELCKMGVRSLDVTKREATKLVFGEGKKNSLDQMPTAALGLLALGSIQTYQDLLKNPPIAKTGSSLTIQFDLPTTQSAMVTTYAASAVLLLPAVQKLREAAGRSQSQNNLKQIGLALHNYHDVYGAFPPAYVVDKKGKPLLSWRVLILPFIEQENLYRQFKLDEPWDSENNKKLISKMPKIFKVASAPLKDDETFYRIVINNGSAWNDVRSAKLTDFTDGVSNTILCFEAAESEIWTKPAELEYDPKKPLPKFGNFYENDGFNALLGDGSVRFIRSTIDEKVLRALLTRAGGEVFDLKD